MAVPLSPMMWTDDPSQVRPMLATLHEGPVDDALLNHAGWVYEPKYDGMRVLAAIEPGEPLPRVTLRSRQGNDKTAQFPDVVRALKAFARSLRRPVVLDGELVALDERGEPVGFQRLAGRIHLTSDRDIRVHAGTTPVAFIAFDVLRDGGQDLRRLPLVDRKAKLEKVIGNSGSELVRLGEMSAGEGQRLYDRALRLGWEGLVAKDASSLYESGRRTPLWRKIKLPWRQEFVVGGWTDPKSLRQHFGALALGYHDDTPDGRVLRWAGNVGSGFTGAELTRLWKKLQPIARESSPFVGPPPVPRSLHFVEPTLVAEVQFTEWTTEGVLRHPVYLGLRDDVDPQAVVREDTARPEARDRRAASTRRGAPSSVARAVQASAAASPAPDHGRKARGRKDPLKDAALEAVVEQLDALEKAKKDGRITLPDGQRLDVTNLGKVFWPDAHITKGELLRYYVRVSPWLLPVVSDRPLVMKRFPNGISGKTFYQQRAPDDVPAGVRVEKLEEDGDVMPRLVGGDLQTLLYMTQLAAISQDPWFSRVGSPDHADYVAIDLDPMPGVPFAQVLEVARHVRDTLAALDVMACYKTSGSSGLHIYIPLDDDTTYESGQLFCQIVATVVATEHPKIATVERQVSRRGRTVYVDYLQNILGKTIATAYSARASEFAGVSTPLAPEELDTDIRPEDFTIRTVLTRFQRVGNLWAPMTGTSRVALRDVLERLATKL